jgi:aminomethyltransferase
MPMWFAGAMEEHRAVREKAGVFDVSHMLRMMVIGPDAARFLRYICTWNVLRLKPGQGHYALICNRDGGIRDDVYVFCLSRRRYLLIANAANADAVRARLNEVVGRYNVHLEDRHESTVMLAVQGPMALELLGKVIGKEFVESLEPRGCAETRWRRWRLFASRTGYTGEDGLELVIHRSGAKALYKALLEVGIVPCGLAARDSLRREASLALHGHEITILTDPWMAGLGWTITLNDGADFIGRRALIRIKAEREKHPATQWWLVCLQTQEGIRSILRDECTVLLAEQTVGRTTSGGPWLTAGEGEGSSIAMAYVPTGVSDNAKLCVDVRGNLVPVSIVPRPFYRRKKKN